MLAGTPIDASATEQRQTIRAAVCQLQEAIVDGDIVRRYDTECAGILADVSFDELGSRIDTTITLTQGNEKCPAEFAERADCSALHLLGFGFRVADDGLIRLHHLLAVDDAEDLTSDFASELTECDCTFCHNLLCFKGLRAIAGRPDGLFDAANIQNNPDMAKKIEEMVEAP